MTAARVIGRSGAMFLSLLAAGAALAGDPLDHDEVKRLRDSGRILPMDVVLARAAARQPGELVEAELEREDGAYRYEIRILDDRGRIHELTLDAASAALIEHGEED